MLLIHRPQRERIRQNDEGGSHPRGVLDSSLVRAASSVATDASTSVAMLPGPMALTLMPCSASDRAMHRVRLLTPPLLALYLAGGEVDGCGDERAPSNRKMKPWALSI